MIGNRLLGSPGHRLAGLAPPSFAVSPVPVQGGAAVGATAKHWPLKQEMTSMSI
jgi:hypothetical protein